MKVKFEDTKVVIIRP